MQESNLVPQVSNRRNQCFSTDAMTKGARTETRYETTPSRNQIRRLNRKSQQKSPNPNPNQPHKIRGPALLYESYPALCASTRARVSRSYRRAAPEQDAISSKSLSACEFLHPCLFA